jgi:hypothetical protein
MGIFHVRRVEPPWIYSMGKSTGNMFKSSGAFRCFRLSADDVVPRGSVPANVCEVKAAVAEGIATQSAKIV